MISNKETAQQVSDLMLEIGARFNHSIALVQASSSEAEFEHYRSVVGKLMGAMFFDVMQPLYEEHPEIKPVELS